MIPLAVLLAAGSGASTAATLAGTYFGAIEPLMKKWDEF